ncbi:hypothetical protein CL654_00800 [bacterium]|nr:hypothetical protein [bacterium]|tara:strand:+ start:3305 stop:5683 length:2379 start_codon:yes stop_codon:yes gene_type:complete
MTKHKKSTSGKEEKKKLILLDVHAIIHRAYHALPDFTSSKGEPTGALYGLSGMLIKIIRELKPDYLIACYDLPKPTFRHEAYKDYKAGRKEADNALVDQLKRSYEVFQAFGIPIYEKEGFEADDIIGTIAQETKKDKTLETIIASGDMDTLQLVDKKKVQVYTLRKGLSDTIMYDEKRVEERFGFGPELLPDFKGLRGDPSDNIIGIKGIGEKTATTLIQEFGALEPMYKALKKNKEAFLKAGLKERIIKLLEEGKEDALFSKVLAQIRRDAPVNFKVPQKEWTINSHKEPILELFGDLGFRSLVNRLEELAPSEKKKDEEEEKEDVDEEDVKKTALALWLVNSNLTNPNLHDILQYANTKSYKKAKEKVFFDLKKAKLESVYQDIELPLIPVLKKMNEHGVKVDIDFLKKLSKKYHTQLSKIEKEVWDHAGEEFNINSPKQLGEILYDKLDIRGARIKKTAGGARSTKASELEKLKELHPIIQKILDYRELQKLLSTYIDNIPDMVGDDGRLHAEFIQTGTTTGRFSSQNPNLQNIPIKTDLGKVIRKAFVAEKGYKLVAFDYSQIELRVAALLSGDKKLKEIFESGHDVHTATAAEVFKVSFDEVTPNMRRTAKVINFGILYGMGVNSLKQTLETSREEAQKFYTNYFQTFKGLAAYLEKTKEDARKNGYTETYFGRKRYFPGISSSLPYIRAMEERMAINAPIQGSNADMVKIAMIEIDKELQDKKLDNDAYAILQIHDELVYEIKEDKIKKVSNIVKDIMESVIKKDIPFIVDAKAGYNWDETEPLSL